tara:strand:- start:1000 stop:1134 length:135 start_codon:yes stop_codon:yes gene_type:complete
MIKVVKLAVVRQVNVFAIVLFCGSLDIALPFFTHVYKNLFFTIK